MQLDSTLKVSGKTGAIQPRKLILGFDATNDAIHGKQEVRFFHGY